MATSTYRLRSSVKKDEAKADQQKPADAPETIPEENEPPGVVEDVDELPQVVKETSASSPKFVLDDSDDESAVISKEPNQEEPNKSDEKAATEPQLTQEQVDRIEANRKRALELREAKQKAAKM